MAALSALRTDLFVKLRDTNNRILTAPSQVNTLLNNALQEWCNRTDELRQENAYDVVSGQFDYAAPTDMNKLLLAIWMPTRTPIEIVNVHELEAVGGYAPTGAGVPQMLVVEGVQGSYRLRLWPAANATSSTTTINDAGGISSSDTTCGITASANLRAPSGWILCQSEKILYQGNASNSLTILRRGMGGTTAASHADALTVTQCDLHIVYARQPAALSSDTDIPEINARWHSYLVWHALASAYRLDGRGPEADAAERKWEMCVRQGATAVRRSTGASPAHVLGSPY